MMKSSKVLLNEAHNSLQYAGFTRRLKAFGYDYLLILGYIILLAAVTVAVIKISGLFGLTLQWPENPILADLLAFVTLVLPVILYFTFQEGSAIQATWGKRKAGIRVVRTDGAGLTKYQALVRSCFKLLPWQIAHTCLFHIPGWPLAVASAPPCVTFGFASVYVLVGIYVISALLTNERRTLYDRIAGSCVIVEVINREGY